MTPVNWLFDLGEIRIMPDTLIDSDAINNLLRRHSLGDGVQDDNAIVNGERIISKYELGYLGTVEIITEADRSVTTVLLPSERGKT